MSRVDKKVPWAEVCLSQGCIDIFFSVCVCQLLKYCTASKILRHQTNLMYLEVCVVQQNARDWSTVMFSEILGLHAGIPLKLTFLWVVFTLCFFCTLKNKLNANTFFRQVSGYQLLQYLICKHSTRAPFLPTASSDGGARSHLWCF